MLVISVEHCFLMEEPIPLQTVQLQFLTAGVSFTLSFYPHMQPASPTHPFLSRFVVQVESRDTLNSIALKFDSTPNELVQLNKLFSRAVVPGQVWTRVVHPHHHHLPTNIQYTTPAAYNTQPFRRNTPHLVTAQILALHFICVLKIILFSKGFLDRCMVLFFP